MSHEVIFNIDLHVMIDSISSTRLTLANPDAFRDTATPGRHNLRKLEIITPLFDTGMANLTSKFGQIGPK